MEPKGADNTGGRDTSKSGRWGNKNIRYRANRLIVKLKPLDGDSSATVDSVCQKVCDHRVSLDEMQQRCLSHIGLHRCQHLADRGTTFGQNRLPLWLNIAELLPDLLPELQ